MGATQSDLESFKDPGPAVTEDRILRAVKKHENTEDVTIEKMEDSAGNIKGEGFMSALVILKVEAVVDGQKKSYSWVIKSVPREVNRAVMSMKFKADEREINFFGNLLPALKKFLSLKGLPELLPNFCSVPFCSWTEKDKVLVMQNLKEEGWRDALNKKAGLDIEHVRSAMKWLANYHAVTYAFLSQYEGGLEQAKKDFSMFFWTFNDLVDWDKEIGPFRDMGNNAQRTMFKGFDDEGTDGKYEGFLENIIEKHLDIGTAAMKVRDQETYKLKTICHGDPWFNNMMFKYKDGKKLDDIIFIDFQLVGYVSPTLDLVYFLASSTTGQLREKYLPHILTLYHTTFISMVNRLGVMVDFSYEDLLEDFRKARLHGLNFALSALPAILAEKPEDILDTEEWAKALNETDEELKNQKLKKLMDQQNASFHTSDTMGQRIKDLVSEFL